MASQLTPQERQAIIADIKAGELSRNAIAKKHHRGPATITDIAKKAGLANAFDRSETENATKAAQIDAKARRLEISREFLEKAGQLLAKIDQQHLAFSFGGRDNVYRDKMLKRPPPAEIRNLMISAATAFDKHMAADKHDSDTQGLSAVDEFLAHMLDGDG